MPRRTRHSWKSTFPMVTLMTCVSIVQSLLYCLILDPLVWMYSTIHDVLCCCFASSLSSTSSATITSSSSTSTTPESSASFYFLQGDWVVHERQSLQLCAVHTINNLLQLTHDHRRNRDLPWICGNRIIKWTTTNTHHDVTANSSSSSQQQNQQQLSLLPAPASQVELDRIACDLMKAEDALLDHSSRYYLGNSNYCYCRWLPSFRCCHSWNNTHRTLYYGNYSFETLEVALQRRHVSLEWFHVPTNDPEELLKVPAGIVVGFIINHVMNDDDNDNHDNHDHPTNNNNNTNTKRKSFPRSVWKKCCDDPGRHWYAITRVRRRGDNSIWNPTTKNNSSNITTTNNNNNNSSGVDDVINEEAPEEDRWKILDSDRMGEATILRTDEVREYLQQVSDQDATIFRATLTLP